MLQNFCGFSKIQNLPPPSPHTVFLPSSKSEFVKAVMKRQKNIVEVFLKHKDLIYVAKDQVCLDPMSDILDITNWNLESFDPKDKENQDEDGFFTEEIKRMRQKSESEVCKNFYEDLEAGEVIKEMLIVLKIIYEYEMERNILCRAADKKHIIDQWTSVKLNYLK